MSDSSPREMRRGTCKCWGGGLGAFWFSDPSSASRASKSEGEKEEQAGGLAISQKEKVRSLVNSLLLENTGGGKWRTNRKEIYTSDSPSAKKKKRRKSVQSA